MKEIDAAIQALEADDSKLWPSEKRTKAIAGLRSLKEQEPVAWCALSIDGKHISYFDGKPVIMTGEVGNDCHPDPLFTAPQQPQPVDAKTKELRCVISDLHEQAKEITRQRERLLASLRAASNYVDVLGGVSQAYRQLIAEIEDFQ